MKLFLMIKIDGTNNQKESMFTGGALRISFGAEKDRGSLVPKEFFPSGFWVIMHRQKVGLEWEPRRTKNLGFVCHPRRGRYLTEIDLTEETEKGIPVITGL